VRAISGQVAIFLLGGAGNSDHMISNNNNMLSYVIRREERLALKDRFLTANKERSWFEPTIRDLGHDDSKTATIMRALGSRDPIKLPVHSIGCPGPVRASDLVSDLGAEDPFLLQTNPSDAQSWITLERINATEPVFRPME